MKKILLATIGILPLFMSACTTIMLHEGGFETHSEQGILLHDQLIAVGVPAKPIKGYENALAIAGNQYSYLVKPSTHRNDKAIQEPLDLTKILNEVDLKYLAVGQLKQTSSQNEDQKQDAISPKFEIVIDDSTKALNHTIKDTEISFIYYKPQSLIKSGEIEHLQSLGFKCEVIETANRCLNTGFIDITVAKAISNKNQLKHVLRRPLELNVRYNVSKINSSDVAKKIVLTPLSVAFDIVTSPVQLVGILSLTTYILFMIATED